MLIAQISDTHISEPGQMTCGVAPMAENLKRCVDSINALEPLPDLVLLSGDVTDKATAAQARHAAEILAGLTMPLYVVPGNHDSRQVLAEAFGPAVCPTNNRGLVNYVVEGYPLRVIAFDTLDPAGPGGRLGKSSLDWISACLKDGGEQPTLLVAHHPPLDLGVPETDQDGFVGAEALAAIVSRHPNIVRFLCGHIHLHTNTLWCGTCVTTAPSTGMQLTLDLTQKTVSRFLLSSPAYLLHVWTPGQNLTTHQIVLSDLSGPFDFDG